MSFTYFNQMENQARATRIAREMLKPLAVSDIECMIGQSRAFDRDEYNKLCAAIDSDFPATVKRLAEIEDRLLTITTGEVEELFAEFVNERIAQEGINQIAYFNLGFQAALRLLGGQADMRVVDGGAQAKKEAS